MRTDNRQQTARIGSRNKVAEINRVHETSDHAVGFIREGEESASVRVLNATATVTHSE
jgi:hypothetical protein